MLSEVTDSTVYVYWETGNINAFGRDRDDHDIHNFIFIYWETGNRNVGRDRVDHRCCAQLPLAKLQMQKQFLLVLSS